MAKDFTGIKAGKAVTDTIAEATAEPAQETQTAHKERKTYTAQEAAEFMQQMKTNGRKGLKLPRINLAFAPDIYEYCRTMARAAGMNYTDFVNRVLRQHMDEHQEAYQRAIEFREDLF